MAENWAFGLESLQKEKAKASNQGEVDAKAQFSDTISQWHPLLQDLFGGMLKQFEEAIAPSGSIYDSNFAAPPSLLSGVLRKHLGQPFDTMDVVLPIQVTPSDGVDLGGCVDFDDQLQCSITGRNITLSPWTCSSFMPRDTVLEVGIEDGRLYLGFDFPKYANTIDLGQIPEQPFSLYLRPTSQNRLLFSRLYSRKWFPVEKDGILAEQSYSVERDGPDLIKLFAQEEALGLGPEEVGAVPKILREMIDRHFIHLPVSIFQGLERVSLSCFSSKPLFCLAVEGEDFDEPNATYLEGNLHLNVVPFGSHSYYKIHEHEGRWEKNSLVIPRPPRVTGAVGIRVLQVVDRDRGLVVDARHNCDSTNPTYEVVRNTSGGEGIARLFFKESSAGEKIEVIYCCFPMDKDFRPLVGHGNIAGNRQVAAGKLLDSWQTPVELLDEDLWRRFNRKLITDNRCITRQDIRLAIADFDLFNLPEEIEYNGLDFVQEFGRIDSKISPTINTLIPYVLVKVPLKADSALMPIDRAYAQDELETYLNDMSPLNLRLRVELVVQ